MNQSIRYFRAKVPKSLRKSLKRDFTYYKVIVDSDTCCYYYNNQHNKWWMSGVYLDLLCSCTKSGSVTEVFEGEIMLELL